MDRAEYERQFNYYSKRGGAEFAAWGELVKLQGEVGRNEIEPLEDYLTRMEKERITEIYKRASGNKSLTAKALGISRPTLYRKLIQFDIKPQTEIKTNEVAREDREYQEELKKAMKEFEETIVYKKD